MIPLVFLGLATVIPLLGLAVVALIGHARRDRWDDGMKDFERRRRALAKASQSRGASPGA